MQVSLRAVIFDYGNVLSAPQNSAEIAAMSALFDVSVPQFVEAYWRHRLAYDGARLDAATYWNMVAHELGRHLPPHKLDQIIELDTASWLYPNPIAVEWARKIPSNGLRTGLISNLPVALKSALENGCPWLPHFDQRTYSCDLHTTKPDPVVYRHCLAGLGVEPSEALFLDDREENVAGAEAVGMHGLIFKSAAESIPEIERLYFQVLR